MFYRPDALACPTNSVKALKAVRVKLARKMSVCDKTKNVNAWH